MMLSAVEPSICEEATLTPPRAAESKRLEAGELGLERSLAVLRLA